MDDLELAEGIYVKRSISNIGGGGTSRTCVMETLWYPCGAENGFVELYPVMDNLKSVLRLSEKVPVDVFKAEYEVKDDSKEVYLELSKTVK